VLCCVVINQYILGLFFANFEVEIEIEVDVEVEVEVQLAQCKKLNDAKDANPKHRRYFA